MRLAKAFIPLLCLVAAPAFAGPAAPAYVWWEGESPSETNFPDHSWFSASSFKFGQRRLLSGGEWLSIGRDFRTKEAFARYQVQVPADGEYTLWARKFWKHGPFRWRFDKQPWRTCGRDVALVDSVQIRKHLVVNWVCLGAVRLTRGKRDFELRLLESPLKKTIACFDCFALVRGPFLPRGALKPGQKTGLCAKGTWAFEPASDTFGKAVLDLRPLNEKTAGESGYVRRVGERFALGNGAPVRFWGVNCGANVVRLDSGSQQYLARRLAKVGVNLVRIHAPLYSKKMLDQRKVDPSYLDRLHSFVAALRKQGVYTCLSFYFPLWFHAKEDYWLEGYNRRGNKNPYSILFFNKEMQKIHRNWARKLLLSPNPYTGIPLARDPAVAIIEAVNEDSFLFWTFTSKMVPREQMRRLEGLFGAWLIRRHGSLHRAFSIWGGARHKRDEPSTLSMGIHDVWHLTSWNINKIPNHGRLSDQLRFLVETQKSFYQGFVSYCKRDLGYKGLVLCGNWKTADPRLLDALERYTYTAGDVIDRHGYFGGEHKGPRASYAVDKGDTYADRAGVLEPWALPIAVHQTEGFPHFISEIGWTNPNRFRAEYPFLCAVYGSLQGTDGYGFFTISGAGWETCVNKFPLATPVIMGQFPATALMFRRGDVREAPVVFREVLGLKDLYDFKGSAHAEAAGFDKLRKPGAQGARTATRGELDPRAFYVGRVLRRFGLNKSARVREDLSRHIDSSQKIIRSATGQVVWDYGKGVVRLDSPRSQGMTGFLGKAGAATFSDVALKCNNEYGAVIVISLDDLPIASSRKTLIQAMTEARPYAWRTHRGAIRNLGFAPMNVTFVDAAVTLKRKDAPKQILVLDEHGFPKARLKGAATGSGLRIQLPKDAIYTVVQY